MSGASFELLPFGDDWEERDVPHDSLLPFQTTWGRIAWMRQCSVACEDGAVTNEGWRLDYPCKGEMVRGWTLCLVAHVTHSPGYQHMICRIGREGEHNGGFQLPAYWQMRCMT